MEYAFDHDRRADFSTYRTYAWTSTLPEKQWAKALREDLMIRRVVDQVDQSLAARGFHKAESQADFLVAFTPLMRNRTFTTGTGHFGWTHLETRRVREAGLQLDILDGASRKVVWSGLAGGGFQGRLTPENSERVIAEAVNQLLARFPPKK